MKDIIRDRDRGVTYDVHWNDDNQLIEPNGAKLTSYIGTLARIHIPITCDRWTDATLDEGKQKIWTDIKVPYMVVVICFLLLNDNVFKLFILTHSFNYLFDFFVVICFSQRSFNIEDNRRKYCLQVAGKRHRGWRSFLTNKYLKDEEGNFVKAEYPTKYGNFIGLEEWDAFVNKRIENINFKQVSDTNRQRASKPAYPYKKGRLGYARLQQKIVSIYKCYDLINCLNVL